MQWIISAIFWLQAFAGPVIAAGLLAFFLYSKGEHNKNIAIAILIAGGIAGIILAEWIRRKYGLDTFFGRIYGPNEMDEKMKGTKTS